MTGNGFLVADGETLNLEFLVKIRLMLDHKYKDFLMKGCGYQQNSKMVEYAYWWLGKFTVDSQTMGLINRGEYDFFDETQRIMYRWSHTDSWHTCWIQNTTCYGMSTP